MILVTGATGHIGNVLVRELLARGEKVCALVIPNDDLTCLQSLDVEIIEGDVLDLESVRRACKEVTDVFHLAAIITIMPGKNERVQQVNVEGTKNVLKAAYEAGVHRFIYTSTIHALKRVPDGVIDESVPFDPNNPVGTYDRSKAQATLTVLEAVKRGLDAVVVCPTGVIGPYDYRVSSMTESILSCSRGETQTYIENAAYDFVDVRDVVAGLLAAREKGRSGESYILSGERVPSHEMHQLIQKITGIPFRENALPLKQARVIASLMAFSYRITRGTPRFTPYALEVLISNSNFSHAKATRELGYQPRPLKQSFADTIAWHKDHPELGAKKNQ
jgi:dihydroflavonol-4-reductase